MKKGILIFAHNNRDVDYALMAIISAGLAKKHLNVPATLVTDKFTKEWMEKSKIYSKAESIFEKIILVEKPSDNNTRLLYDGNSSKTVPFNNSNRSSAYELTPYDRTLLIDSDYLIFSDRLKNYWDLPNSVMISSAMNEITGDRIGFADKHVSETGVPLYWATTVMFSKDTESRLFFDLVNYIRINYNYYADLFRFSPTQYRNDISFSVAKHILSGFETDKNSNLPPILTVLDKDLIHSIENDKIRFIVNSNNETSIISMVSKTDIHIMNKQSIIRNADKFLEMI